MAKIQNIFRAVTNPDYAFGVISNMNRHGASRCHVQFGEMGEGKRPNYQIIDQQGEPHVYAGNGHGPSKWGDLHDEYSRENLTEPVSAQAVLAFASFVVASNQPDRES